MIELKYSVLQHGAAPHGALLYSLAADSAITANLTTRSMSDTGVALQDAPKKNGTNT